MRNGSTVWMEERQTVCVKQQSEPTKWNVWRGWEWEAIFFDFDAMFFPGNAFKRRLLFDQRRNGCFLSCNCVSRVRVSVFPEVNMMPQTMLKCDVAVPSL